MTVAINSMWMTPTIRGMLALPLLQHQFLIEPLSLPVLNLFWTVSINHFFHEANRCVNMLAKHGHNVPFHHVLLIVNVIFFMH
jgi:hypothetical protein